ARLPAQWTSELDYTWSSNSFETASPSADFTALGNALSVGTLNPFVDTNAYPLNLTPYLAYTDWATRATLSDLALRASGPIGSFPWGRPTLPVGLEHRLESFDDSTTSYTETAVPSNDYNAVFFGQPATTDSVYAEALVPLVTAENSVLLIHSLDLQLAGRSERYTVRVGPASAYVAPDGSLENYAPGSS